MTQRRNDAIDAMTLQKQMDQETQENIYESLETLKEADEYYQWLFSRVKPFVRGKALEIGSGIGNFAKWAKSSSSEYHVSDADPALVKVLEKDFPVAFEWNIYEPFPRKDRYDHYPERHRTSAG
jgi:hypothetical protein